MRKEHVAEEVLGAYVDGELDADALARIEERLSGDRALRDRLAALQRVTDLVRAAAHATPPADSQASAATHTRTGSASRAGASDARSERAPAAEPSRTFSRPVVWGIAASFVAALAGALLTVLLLGRDAGVDGWQQHALVFHESYLAALDANRTPLLDARASSPAALGKSLAALVDDELVVVPDLSEQGYAPQGARLIETAAGPVTYVVYAGVNKPVLGLAVLRWHRTTTASSTCISTASSSSSSGPTASIGSASAARTRPRRCARSRTPCKISPPAAPPSPARAFPRSDSPICGITSAPTASIVHEAATRERCGLRSRQESPGKHRVTTGGFSS